MATRVFVGTPANNEDLECQAVLDYSLRLYQPDIDVTWMMVSRDPASPWFGWNMSGWATPFSALRWGIPAACNYEGRAIYMDCDMIAKADMGELERQPIPDGKAFLAKREIDGSVVSCVMLFDCARMKGWLPEIAKLKTQPGLYRHVRRGLDGAMASYTDDWNCRDGEGCTSVYDPHVKVVHYTNIPTQPNHPHARKRLAKEGRLHWYNGTDRAHPRPDVTSLFNDTLAAAIAAGRGPETFRVHPGFGAYGR